MAVTNNLLLAKWRMPLAVFAVLVILVVAAIDTIGLAWLRKMPEEHVDLAATARLSERGAKLVHFLANRREVRGTSETPPDWNRIHYFVDTLDAAQTGLQYVDIDRNGQTVFFHHPGRTWHDGRSNVVPEGLGWITDKSTVSLTRTSQVIDGEDVTILHFSQEFPAADGALMRVEVALRRDATDEMRKPADEGVSVMFHIAILATVISFAVCIVIVFWAIRRDTIRERFRRQEEHLAFSGVLANGIVHDFRNPMSSVRLDAQMLAREVRRPDGPRGDRIVELSSRINHTMERMDGVFREFLYMARPDSGTIEKIDLRELISVCLETLSPRFDAAGVKCRISINGQEQAESAGGHKVAEKNGAPLFVSVMPASFRRALANIVLNAIQFSPNGETVEIAAAETGQGVCLEVRDRGPGIGARDRERIFEMFTTSRPGGTGLGLFIARTAVTQSGGTISALQREGGGTVMRIVLPRIAD